MRALRPAMTYQAANVDEVVAQWYAELAVDFGEDGASQFFATVLPCARSAR